MEGCYLLRGRKEGGGVVSGGMKSAGDGEDERESESDQRVTKMNAG